MTKKPAVNAKKTALDFLNVDILRPGDPLGMHVFLSSPIQSTDQDTYVAKRKRGSYRKRDTGNADPDTDSVNDEENTSIRSNNDDLFAPGEEGSVQSGSSATSSSRSSQRRSTRSSSRQSDGE